MTTPKPPQDHQKPAAQIEAEADTTLEFEWQGFKLSIPADVESLDIEAIEALEQGQGVTGCKAILGAQKFETLKSDFRAKTGAGMTVRDFGQLMEAIASTYGFTQGK